eukprot:755372-Hanusia_phi.AAC.5
MEIRMSWRYGRITMKMNQNEIEIDQYTDEDERDRVEKIRIVIGMSASENDEEERCSQREVGLEHVSRDPSMRLETQISFVKFIPGWKSFKLSTSSLIDRSWQTFIFLGLIGFAYNSEAFIPGGSLLP